MASHPASVGYVLMGFPRVSETFIASELLRVEQAGVPLRLFVVKPVEERERGLRHPVVDAIQARPEHLPDAASLTKPLHRWRRADLAPFVPAITPRRAPPPARPRPRARHRRRAGAARPPHPLLGPAQDLHQGAAPGDRARRPPARRARRPPPARALRARHDDDHLARGAHRRPAVQLHRPRARHLRRAPQPEGLAAPQAARRPLRRHLHGGERPAPPGRSRPRRRSTSSTTASTPTSPGCSREPANPPPTRNGDLRVLAVGRHVAKKGFDVLVDACAVLRRRGVPFEAAIVGQEDKHSAAIQRPHRRARARAARRCSPARWARHELLDEYRRASALCMPSRLLPDDRDGIPNVLVEAMAAGTPVIASAVSGIPELVEHEVNGLLVEPDDPEALADTLLRLHEDPRSRRALADSGRETVARALRRPDAGRPPRRAVPGSGPRVTSAVARRPRPVLCMTEHEHRSRAVADAVVAGRFTVAGETRALGTDPDWHGADLPQDAEWRIEWVKFAWGLDLAHAGYQRPWEELDRVLDPPVRARRGRRRGHRPPHPQLDLRLAALRAGRRARRRACSPASPTRSRTSARTSPPRATTARSSSTRC